MNNDTTFIHAIDLANRTTCKYILDSGSINSLMATTFDTPARSDFYFIPLEDYRDHADEIFKEVINPRSAVLLFASLIRQGKMVFANGNPEEIDEKTKDRYLRTSELELTFEAVRREIAPAVPSRITCLYLAEDNLEGRENLRDMLTAYKRPFVFEIGLLQPYFGLHKADNRWLELYRSEPVRDHVENYWLGKPYNNIPTWEYLFEGSAVFINDEDRDTVQQEGNL
jgi:hypothetical protein